MRRCKSLKSALHNVVSRDIKHDLRRRRVASACAALLICCASATHAAGSAANVAAAGNTDEVRQLASLPLDALLDLQVTGAARYAQRQSQTAASVTVITAAEIRALGYRTLADVLRSVRGVTVADDRSYAYLGVRGFYAPGDYNTRVLLLVDGNRLNDNVYDQAYLGSEFPIDLALVERVEFIPGQGSALYGANALFGVVNVITKAAGEPGTHGASISAGSGDLREARIADVHRLPDGTTLQWSASRRLVAGTDTFLAEQMQPDGSGGVSHGTDYERRTNLYVRADHGDWSATAVRSERLKGAPVLLGAVYGDPRTNNRDEHSLLDLTWHHVFDAETDATARWFMGHYLFVGHYAWDYPPVTVNEDLVTGQWWGVEARAMTRRWEGHTLLAGVELQQNTHLRQANADLNVAHTTYLDDSRSSQRAAVFAEDDIALTPQWNLTAGARWDRQRGYSGEFNPRLALVWHPSDAVDAKLIHGSAYRAPNAYEAFYRVDMAGGYKLNPDLRSETVRGTELALDWRAGAHDRVSASLFDNRASRLLTLELDPDGMYIFRNVGSVHAQGFELEGEHVWRGGARLRANLTVQRAHDSGSPQPLAGFAPRRMAKVMQVLPLTGDWSLGASWRGVSPRGAAAGYGALDLALTRPLPSAGWSVSASVFDLFDRRGADPGSDLERQPIVPQRGRSLLLQLDYGF